MKKLLTLMAFICFWANANAQYVNIPDSNFRNWLILQYPTCFNSAGQMDTVCVQSITDTFSNSIIGTQIVNLDGIQYFKSFKTLTVENNSYLDNIPALPPFLIEASISLNSIDKLPHLPPTLNFLTCSGNKLIQLPALPQSLKTLNCSGNQLLSLPQLPQNLEDLICYSNELHSLPILPNNLERLICESNPIVSLPTLPKKLKWLFIQDTKIACLPLLPRSLIELGLDTIYIKCLQNFPDSCLYITAVDTTTTPPFPLCNPTNNSNHCQSFPVIQSYVYTGINNNKYPKHNIKLTLSNNNYTYTNTQGTAYINADSLGTYTITAQAPPLYKAVPASYTHTFNSYDTLVLDTFALQPAVIKDSIAVDITPVNFAARPGFNYVYEVAYENVGTTVVNPNLSFVMDTSKYIFDNTNNAAINFSGNTLSLGANNFVPGQTNSFLVYGRVKPTAVLGSSLQAIASITGGSATAVDTAKTTVRGSFDPNDKQATPQLSVAQVADNKYWIDYTIRFENTGSDTAFTVVVADTLDDSKVQTNTLQLTGLSHNCKVSQNDKIVYFEFLNINLPDSNTNKTACNGFVNFRVKPLTTLVNGNIVPNKASIYFDYNEPIITNTAKTIIGNVLPLSLTALGAIPKPENNTVLVYWNTANEINTSYFIIEQSTDARTFKAAAEVAAIGKGNNSYYYNIAKNNVQYIRLKMVDKNGTYSYSNIIRIAVNDKQDAISVVSPAKGVLKINVIAASLNNTKASLINSEGKVVKTFILKQGYQAIDIAALPSGLYYVQVNDVVRKIIVERL